MIFSTEKELQKELASLDLDFNGSYGALCTRREVPVGGRIPDVVCIGFKAHPGQIPWPRSWSYRHSYVTWLLRRHPRLTPRAVAKRLFESLERTNPLIQDLVRSGAVLRTQGDSLELSSVIASQEAEVIAIEAKLRRWRKALEQAANYKRFANVVVVAMDPGGIPRTSEALMEFDRLGIGLCAILGGEIQWHVQPRFVEGLLGPEREYLIRSATASDRQTLWSWRKPVKASLHA